MARRNPLEETKKRYFKNLKFIKIYSWLFYHDCIKCGDEFCREQMYKCEERSICLNDHLNYYYGCTHCFANENEFRQYLEDNRKILKEKDFETYNDRLIR